MITILLIFIYIFYIGLGIPDSLLGTAWPAIYQEFHMPVSYVSIISTTISLGTVLSSLFSAHFIARLGTAKITALSTCLTATALLGFSCSPNFIWLCLCAIPLGIGAGSIDTALNNYVALHYKAMQMNFLHCFYGIGVSLSPYLMSLALSDRMNWRLGYRTAFFIQLSISLLSVLSLPVWKHIRETKQKETLPIKVLSFGELVKNRTICASCGIFIGISALESTCLIWGSTFLVDTKGLSAHIAAEMITFYFVGLALGRFISGLLTLHYSDWQIIAGGYFIIFLALVLLLVQSGSMLAVLGLFLIGLGNGPVFPNMTHLTPRIFGRALSQSIIGIQMAFSYLSIMLTPIFFGMLAQKLGTLVFAPFLFVMFLFMLASTMVLKINMDVSSRKPSR